ncbi:transcription factor NIGT1-like [Miscanthus floridulus]|uniref:transcription factor NIGT1-like n=1 Tax=Miscanthus floridulus TaxID=154761 RepID=UPI00345836D9
MEMDPPPPLHADRRRRCSEYLLALEEERRKIQVFQRELPLCLDLVTQTIEGMRNHMDSIVGGSEETVSDHGGPVLEEFMPLKPTLSSSSSEDDGEEHDSSHHQRSAGTSDDGVDADKSDEAAAGDPETAAARASSGRRRLPQPETKKAMPDWLQSVQLWSNQQQQQPSPPQPHQDELLLPCRPVALSACRKPGGAFQPFEKDKDKEKPKQRTEMPLPASSSATAAASSAVVGDSCDQAGGATDNDTAGNTNKASIKGGGKDKEAQSASQAPGRKPRRCWAPELHRRFLQALQQLGGSHAATPKQIRELMKVDGLTNDEVKSHLQKYRLHTRRPNSTAVAVHNSGTSVTPPAAPQFVVVGGIWVPPPEYAAAAAVAAAAAQPQQVHDLPGDASGTTTTTAN